MHQLNPRALSPRCPFLLWPRARHLLLAAALLAISPVNPLGAQTWERRGPEGGAVISLVATPSRTLYLGTPDGHVFASPDQAQHWELRGRAGDRLDGVVQALASGANPDAPERLLAGVWFRGPQAGGGIFESRDGARSWRPAGLAGEAVRALHRSPSDPRVWVAGTRSGVFLSTDDARTWQRITPAHDPELQNVDSLAIDPQHPEVIYVGTYHLPWKTSDSGKTWSPIAEGMIDDSDIMSLRIDARDPRRIFSSACSGIYRSEDAGASWTKLQGIPYSSRRTQQITQDPADPRVFYAATTEGLWRTPDSGESWVRLTGRETVVNAVVALPSPQGSRILAGTERGVLAADLTGNSLVPVNRGFTHPVIAAAAVDTGNPAHLLIRLAGPDGALLESSDAGLSWRQLPAPGHGVTIDAIHGLSSGWWISFAQGGLAWFDAPSHAWRSADFTDLSRPGPGTGKRSRWSRAVPPHVTKLVETAGQVLAVTADGFWRRAAQGTAFRRVLQKGIPASVDDLVTLRSGGLLAIAANRLWRRGANSTEWLAESAPDHVGRLLWLGRDESGASSQLFLGTEQGVFVRADDGPWRLLANGLPVITSDAPPAIGAHAWLLAMRNGGIYLSRDAGRSWQRVDHEAEAGRAALLAAQGDGFLVASESEGLLMLPNPGR